MFSFSTIQFTWCMTLIHNITVLWKVLILQLCVYHIIKRRNINWRFKYFLLFLLGKHQLNMVEFLLILFYYFLQHHEYLMLIGALYWRPSAALHWRPFAALYWRPSGYFTETAICGTSLDGHLRYFTDSAICRTSLRRPSAAIHWDGHLRHFTETAISGFNSYYCWGGSGFYTKVCKS